jgi:tetratricopeptide (TPR) repeat protein
MAIRISGKDPPAALALFEEGLDVNSNARQVAENLAGFVIDRCNVIFLDDPKEAEALVLGVCHRLERRLWARDRLEAAEIHRCLDLIRKGCARAFRGKALLLAERGDFEGATNRMLQAAEIGGDVLEVQQAISELIAKLLTEAPPSESGRHRRRLEDRLNELRFKPSAEGVAEGLEARARQLLAEKRFEDALDLLGQARQLVTGEPRLRSSQEEVARAWLVDALEREDLAASARALHAVQAVSEP